MTNSIKKTCSRFIISSSLACLVGLGLMSTISVVYAANETTELKFAITEGTKAARTIYGHQKWADAVEKASNGSLKISLFPSGSLVSPKQMYDATINGLADISCISIGHYPGRFPLTEALSFPGSGISNPQKAAEVIMAMNKKYPQMQKEFNAIKPLFFFGFAPMSIATVEKPVRSWDDLKGMRLRINHKGSADYLKKAGVSPAFIAPPDIFLNLQKGIIDGSVMGWFGHHAFGTTKLANYFTEVPSVPGPFFSYIMNKKKFESLTEEQKNAILSVSGENGAAMLAESGEMEIEVSTKSIKEDPKKEIIQLSAEEEEIWAQKAVEAQEKLVKKLSKRGLPAQELIDDVKLMTKKD
ncbi:MAG: TRAP transporter substrate-binding protein DctP [Desulforhopalus sp.]